MCAEFHPRFYSLSFIFSRGIYSIQTKPIIKTAESRDGGDTRRRIITILRERMVQLIRFCEQGCFSDENFADTAHFRLDFLLNFVLRNEEELGVDGLRNLLMEAI